MAVVQPQIQPIESEFGTKTDKVDLPIRGDSKASSDSGSFSSLRSLESSEMKIVAPPPVAKPLIKRASLENLIANVNVKNSSGHVTAEEMKDLTKSRSISAKYTNQLRSNSGSTKAVPNVPVGKLSEGSKSQMDYTKVSWSDNNNKSVKKNSGDLFSLSSQKSVLHEKKLNDSFG